MKDLTQSSWFLWLTVIATFITILTGTATILKFLTPLLIKYLDSYQRKLSGEPTTQSVKDYRDYLTQKERNDSVVVNIGAVAGALISAILSLKWLYQEGDSILVIVLGMLGFGFIGAFLGYFVAFIPTFLLKERKEAIARRLERERLLVPLRKVVAENPNSARDRYLLASELYASSSRSSCAKGREQKGVRREALNEVKRAVQLNPDDSRSYLLLGWILESDKRKRDAVTAFDKALRLRNESTATSARKGLERLRGVK